MLRAGHERTLRSFVSLKNKGGGIYEKGSGWATSAEGSAPWPAVSAPSQASVVRTEFLPEKGQPAFGQNIPRAPTSLRNVGMGTGQRGRGAQEA